MNGGSSKALPVYAGAWNADRLAPHLIAALQHPADASSGAAWFLERALPDGHGLKEILSECHPGLESVEVLAPDCLHVMIAQAEPAWRVLVVLAVAYERGVPRARREEIGKAAKARREAGGLDDVVTALVCPRRVARDFERAWLNGLVTFEVLAERLHSLSQHEAAAALRDACEQQALGTWTDAKARLADFWSGYRDEVQAIAPFVKLVEPLDPARQRAAFRLRGVLPEPRVRPGAVTHELTEGRVVLPLELPGAPRVLDAMREDLPADLRTQADATQLRLWLPAPKLSSTTPTSEQARDVRHALACVLRLQQWLAARARNWSDWFASVSQ